MSYHVLTRDEHFQSPGPKRILALDGGGLRGILTLGYLARMENILRERHHAGADFRLAHYFDLIAGTSTGAIIAAALAKGLSVAEILAHYKRLGEEVFGEKRWFSVAIRNRYDADKLSPQLKAVFGADTTLGSTDLLTGVLVVTKRSDTGSTWPVGNNPSGKYFRAPPGKTWHSNADYPLWQIVRASTAAPTFFDPEIIPIGPEQNGRFVDGGVSPHNNPSLQAFMYATLEGYRVNWKTGADKLMIVSVGTGAARPDIEDSAFAAKAGVNALLGLTNDTAALVEILMQWMSTSPTAGTIDRELGTLGQDLIGGTPQFHYLRYNVVLTAEGLKDVYPTLTAVDFESIAEMDRTKNMDRLEDIGTMAAKVQIDPTHFPAAFDLPAVSAAE